MKVQFLVSIIWHPLCYLVDLLHPNYDQSMDFNNEVGFLDHSMRWDSTFYVENALNGYRYEKNHAFLPGFITVLKMIHLLNPKYYICLTLVCIEVANMISVILLFKTTLMITKNIKVFKKSSQ